jgi:glycine betaine/choline ABC-type transport system substrate-binding protein
MRSRRSIVLSALACVVLVAGCGGGASGGAPGGGGDAAAGTITRNPRNARTTLTIGSKNFTEQRVLGRVYAEGLRAAGYRVRTRLDLGDQDSALQAVLSGRVDGYPEYTGTALVSFFGMRASAIPHDARRAYEAAKAGFAARGLVAFPPTPFTDSNEVAVTRATASRYGLRRISDLARVAGRLTLYGSPECRRRPDCLPGLRQVYGLRFKRFVPVAVGKRHAVLSDGRADVSIVFTTDPQIKRDGEVLLRDDKGLFPPYNSTLVMRKSVADRAGPDLGRTISLLNSQLIASNMQELNARVDLDRRPAAEVAREYLRQTGLVGGP